jgi:hypothetical protein
MQARRVPVMELAFKSATPQRKAGQVNAGNASVLQATLVSSVRRETTFCKSICFARAFSETPNHIIYVSSQTILLVFTPLLLITVLLASVGLLNAVGGEKLPSTLTLSMGGPHKRD